MIRDVTLDDAGRIAEIYNYYIEHTIITFEYDAVTEQEIRSRIHKICDKRYPYIVCEAQGRVVGYAYLNNWRDRAAYNITLETSVYVDKDSIGHGIGSLLYKELINRAISMNIHSLVGGISLPNDTSRRLHNKFNFKPIGNFKESGVKFGKLIDVEFWQLIL